MVQEEKVVEAKNNTMDHPRNQVQVVVEKNQIADLVHHPLDPEKTMEMDLVQKAEVAEAKNNTMDRDLGQEEKEVEVKNNTMHQVHLLDPEKITVVEVISIHHHIITIAQMTKHVKIVVGTTIVDTVKETIQSVARQKIVARSKNVSKTILNAQ